MLFCKIPQICSLWAVLDDLGENKRAGEGNAYIFLLVCENRLYHLKSLRLTQFADLIIQLLSS